MPRRPSPSRAVAVAAVMPGLRRLLLPALARCSFAFSPVSPPVSSPFLLPLLGGSLVASASPHALAPRRPISLEHSPARTMAAYQTEQRGSLYKDDFLLYFRRAEDNAVISPMHDIPLFHDEANKIFNMVVEVPRWSNAKMEISLSSKMNPIKQDVKKGKLRYVANCFPHKGYIWNYGAMPQTWENPEHTDPSTNAKGDGDPVDVCEIGQKVHERGSVVQVKALGVLAMIDEGETDWKVLAIDVTDPLADKLNDVEDIETHMPGFLAATTEWFKIYKMPDGKPANVFAFDGQAKNREFTHNVIKETNEQWVELMSRADSYKDVERACTQGEHASKISADDAQAVVADKPEQGLAEQLDSNVDKWHYVKLE